MDDIRVDPDQLLKVIQTENKKIMRGHLHIFFGYAAGVGKTYAMLKAAHSAKKQGIDVVVGYVEPHMREQTTLLLDGLEALPTKKYFYNGIALNEFDLDKALKRKPKLILVDELAHTNAQGCRHEKRYQDVEELLAAGIDVYTTVNVQHIESLNDMVASITGVIVRERVPDKLFDSADQVKLVDIEPQELITRLNEGKIYKKSRAKHAVNNFFTVENLTALREIALRCCADRMNRLSEAARLKNGSEYYTDEHILVCLSSSPSNQKIIRNAARMAKAFRGSFTALFVETSDFSSMSEENKNRLRNNIHLAQQLGAEIETTYGDDVALQISEFARLFGVSKIVVGRNNIRKKYLIGKPTFTEQLISYAPNLDVYVIPDSTAAPYREKSVSHEKEKFLLSDIYKSIAVLIVATIIGGLFYYLGFSEANIITVYTLGVLVTAIITSRRVYSVVSSVLGVLVFNFFFTEPRFTLNAYDSGYPATFIIMFVAAFIAGTLAVKIKTHAKQSTQTAYRTKILLETNQLLQQAKNKDEVVEAAASQLIKLLNRDVVFYSCDGNNLLEPVTFSADGAQVEKECISENEKAVAAWVMKNNKHAGATTSTLADSKCLYLAVRVNNKVYGVVGIVMGETAMESFENSIMLSILGECALVFESQQAALEKEQAAVLAKNEQLRANLLRSISHDLRTPLTSISGNAGILLASSGSITEEKKIQLYSNIYDDSLWLINLVENLLAVTKIEDGSLHLKTTAELIDEIIEEATHHLDRKEKEHNISIIHSKELLIAKIDARLIMQVIINIVDNAIKYTPAGSNIEICSYKQGKNVVIKISDDGPGISDEAKPHIFDMFYTSQQIVDSRRSLGLGLALCKSIVNAHGGQICVLDNKPNGTIFKFTLPTEEVVLHE